MSTQRSGEPEFDRSVDPRAESQQHLDQLVSEVAELLMTAGEQNVGEVRDTVLERLAQYFTIDIAFLRHNDHVARTTILMAEWPRREFKPDPDPMGVVPFDSDEQMAMTEHLSAPHVSHPADHSDGYKQRVAERTGSGEVSLAAVPMIHGSVTVGCLGFLAFDARTWTEREVQALSAIASMLVQLKARIEAEEQLSFQAFHDDVTGLSNRAAMVLHLEKVLTETTGTPVAAIFVDVDDLKVINDALGHKTGDQLIATMATRLRNLARPGDFVGRLNGDEFIVVLDSEASAQSALLIADRITTELSKPIDIDEKRLSRTVSVGVALAISGTTTADRLLSEVDAAMYAAKRAGKNAVRLFDDSLRAQVLERFEQEMALRQALEHEGEITVHYQPEVDILTGEVLGVEALVRWNHPERGLLPAGAFIETAEDCGLVVPLGRIVLEQASAQLADWRRRFPQVDLKMRINASPAELVDADFVDDVQHALLRHSLPAGSLCIEVTEHVMMEHSGLGMEILHQLCALGVDLAIDDFGTGYSSMSQLKELPFSTLKIDRAFVTDLPDSVHDQAIVDAMLRLAAAFDLEVVAEGVETEAHILELVKLGCRRAQGYLLARPQSAEGVEQLFGSPVRAGSLNLAAGDSLNSLGDPRATSRARPRAGQPDR